MKIFQIFKSLFQIGIGLYLLVFALVGWASTTGSVVPMRGYIVVIICLPVGLYLCFRGVKSIIYINKKTKNDISGD